MLIPVILSGGSGTRLWPLSRELHPKQFLSLLSDKTLFQETLERLDGTGNISEPIVVCNHQHRFLVAEQLRELTISPRTIILEPVGRNTAPALTLSALDVKDEDNAVLLVMPADHKIADIHAFDSAIAEGRVLAEGGRVVTFGIVPTSPETGFGYIKRGDAVVGAKSARSISAFVEKPDKLTAEEYLRSTEYLWNSGMFMVKASVWLEAIEFYQKDMLTVCKNAYDAALRETDFLRISENIFSLSPDDSIDYAVMEKMVLTPKKGFEAAVIPLDAGWSDVGTWDALWQVHDKTDKGNVIKGDVVTHDVSNSFIFAEERLVTAVGLDDIVIVETADAVLVAPLSKSQEVKRIASYLKQQGREEHAIHRRVHRPWGCYEGIDFGERYQVKRIIVQPGASLSLQMHYHRAEHWVVVSGVARVVNGENEILVNANESTFIPAGHKHQLENPGQVDLVMIEVQSGEYLAEDDIVRYVDQYGRETV